MIICVAENASVLEHRFEKLEKSFYFCDFINYYNQCC